MGSPPQQPQRGEGDASLIAGHWFPRPASAADIEVLPPSGDLDAYALHELMTSSGAREQRHKVGVAGRTDGSGKASTRLLVSRGWLFKTNMDALAASRDALHERMREDRARGERAGAWHPTKHWASMRTAAGWLPLTACRELVTLRSFDDLDDRLRAWTEMLSLGIEVHRRSGLGLDLNPANFAVERGGSTLYYLDDELYPTLETRQIAFAIAARIPEEPDAFESTWRGFGREIRDMLDAHAVGAAAVEHVVEEVLGYPLAEAFEPMRAALVSGLRTDRTTTPARAPVVSRDRICVLADVHANLPALQAVVAAARERGVERFLFLGDAVGYGPHPAECVDLLASLPDAIYVRGNHDHAIATGKLDAAMNRLALASAEWTRASLGAAHLAWLGSLPIEHRGEGWLAVHGAPRDPARFFAYVYDLTYEENLDQLGKEGVSLCFHGHTHVPVVHATSASGPAKLAGAGTVDLPKKRRHLVNPGSVGQPRDGDPRASFAIWDRETSQVSFERVGYDLSATVRDMERAGLPSELLTRLLRGT
jgi:diadenosine tetraphosphatase ApaH/serine/threonine PP2A family protein phosphatase